MGFLFGGSSGAKEDGVSASNSHQAQGLALQSTRSVLDNTTNMSGMMEGDLVGARQAANTYYGNAQTQYNNYTQAQANAGANAAAINSIASNYDTADKREQLAQQAGEQVANQGAINNQNLERGLAARGGMSMSAGNLAAMENDNNTQLAATRAAAINSTRTAAEQLGLNYQQAAMGANTGMASMAGTGLGMAGNVANAGAAAFNTDVSGLAGMNSGYLAAGGLANNTSQAATGQYNAYQTYQQNQLGYQQANSSDFGALAGLAASYFTGGGYGALAAAMAQRSAKNSGGGGSGDYGFNQP
jgi:hypothetical protein